MSATRAEVGRLDPLRHLEADLDHLAAQNLLRHPDDAAAEGLLDLCSNDYLGYAQTPWPASEARSGAGASRLVSGNWQSLVSAERAIASWIGAQSALLFSSGYAANVGVLSALAAPGDVIVSDALNHASIIDGCRLSGATVRVVPHLDAGAVDAALAASASARRRWVVTESYFSMDADTPDLERLRKTCDAHDAGLIVDEAHALGVFGPEGRGLCAVAKARPDVLIGTAGKALGLHGAFVVGPLTLTRWLWNRARSFVFSTGISPALGAAIQARVERARSDDTARAQLEANSTHLRALLGHRGGVIRGHGPIIPWIIGAPESAVELSRMLRAGGVLVRAIRPPTVPAGTSRLRFTATAALSSDELARVSAAMDRASR